MQKYFPYGGRNKGYQQENNCQWQFDMCRATGNTILEECMCFTAAEGLDAQSLFASIKRTLSGCNVDINGCVAQCYGGASVMSGKSNGVQELFR